MSAGLLLLRSADLALAFATVFGVVHGVMADVNSAPHRAYRAYVARLDHDLDLLFQPRRGRFIAAAQLALAPVLLVATIASASARPLLGLLLLLVAPVALLRRALRRRRQTIEQHLSGLAKRLANSLRTTPNLVGALVQTQRLSPPGIATELDLLLKELRVGSALEPALLRMCRRVCSHDLDALTSGLLIARQTGGNLSEVLETLGDSLREMARLAGVLRTKTADVRAQFMAIAAFPPVATQLLDFVRPGHFKPLLASTAGWVIMGAALVSWIASLLIARKILAVQL
jgi:tight adherence protein B